MLFRSPNLNTQATPDSELRSETLTKYRYSTATGELLLNLASNEYGKVINRKKLNNPVVDFEFYQTQPNGKLKTIVVYTKHARGLVARFCAETNAKTLNDVKAFNYENYLINEELSTNQKLVFER